MLRAELGGTTRNFFYLEQGGSLCFAQAAELAGTLRVSLTYGILRETASALRTAVCRTARMVV